MPRANKLDWIVRKYVSLKNALEMAWFLSIDSLLLTSGSMQEGLLRLHMSLLVYALVCSCV